MGIFTDRENEAQRLRDLEGPPSKEVADLGFEPTFEFKVCILLFCLDKYKALHTG